MPNKSTGKPDSEAKKRWIRENTKMVTIKLMKKSDADIIAYLSAVPTGPTIKAALREYIAKNQIDEKGE